MKKRLRIGITTSTEKNTERDVHLNITDFYLHYKTKIVHSKTSTYKKKHCMTLKHLSKSTKRCYKSESLLRVTQILRPAPEAPAPPRHPRPYQQTSSEYQWCGLQKEEYVGTENKGLYGRLHFFGCPITMRLRSY